VKKLFLDILSTMAVPPPAQTDISAYMSTRVLRENGEFWLAEQKAVTDWIAKDIRGWTRYTPLFSDSSDGRFTALPDQQKKQVTQWAEDYEREVSDFKTALMLVSGEGDEGKRILQEREILESELSALRMKYSEIHTTGPPPLPAPLPHAVAEGPLKSEAGEWVAFTLYGDTPAEALRHVKPGLSFFAQLSKYGTADHIEECLKRLPQYQSYYDTLRDFGAPPVIKLTIEQQAQDLDDQQSSILELKDELLAAINLNRNHLEAYNESNAILTTQSEALKAKNAEFSRSVESRDEDLGLVTAILNSMNQDLCAEISNPQAALALRKVVQHCIDLEASVVSYKNKISADEQSYNKLLTEASMERENFRRDIGDLSQSLAQYQLARGKADDHYKESLTGLRIALENRSASTIGEIKTALESRSASTSGEIGQIKAALEELSLGKKHTEELQDSVNQLEDRLSQSSTLMRTWEERATRSNSKIEELTEELNTCRNLVEQIKAENEELHKSVRNTTLQNANARAANDRLVHSNTHLQDCLREMEDQMATSASAALSASGGEELSMDEFERQFEDILSGRLDRTDYNISFQPQTVFLPALKAPLESRIARRLQNIISKFPPEAPKDVPISLSQDYILDLVSSIQITRDIQNYIQYINLAALLAEENANLRKTVLQLLELCLKDESVGAEALVILRRCPRMRRDGAAKDLLQGLRKLSTPFPPFAYNWCLLWMQILEEGGDRVRGLDHADVLQYFARKTMTFEGNLFGMILNHHGVTNFQWMIDEKWRQVWRWTPVNGSTLIGWQQDEWIVLREDRITFLEKTILCGGRRFVVDEGLKDELKN